MKWNCNFSLAIPRDLNVNFRPKVISDFFFFGFSDGECSCFTFRCNLRL